MPQLIINYKDTKSLVDTFEAISIDFSKIVELPKEKIYIALNQTPIYSAGIEEDVCMVHIWWKQRSEEVKKQVVEAVSKILKEKGIKKVKITFLDAQKESIYTVL